MKKDLVKVPWSHGSTACLQLSCQICPIKRVSMLHVSVVSTNGVFTVASSPVLPGERVRLHLPNLL